MVLVGIEFFQNFKDLLAAQRFINFSHHLAELDVVDVVTVGGREFLEKLGDYRVLLEVPDQNNQSLVELFLWVAVFQAHLGKNLQELILGDGAAVV